MAQEDLYFSERETGVATPTAEAIDFPFWGGFVALIRRYASRSYFAQQFPLECDDGGRFVVGGDTQALAYTLRAEVDLAWPLRGDLLPPTLQVLDAVEFFARYVSKPNESEFGPHDFMRHQHVGSFDRLSGSVEYKDDVNRLLRRSQHPYVLTEDGRVRRTAPPVVGEKIGSAAFRTGDAELDSMLARARERYLSPDPAVRYEGLKDLWDAWERLKTILPGDKKESVTALLDATVSEPNLRNTLENEARELTRIGNDFMIRHTETDKIALERPEHVEYLFTRLFSLMYLILRVAGWLH